MYVADSNRNVKTDFLDINNISLILLNDCTVLVISISALARKCKRLCTYYESWSLNILILKTRMLLTKYIKNDEQCFSSMLICFQMPIQLTGDGNEHLPSFASQTTLMDSNTIPPPYSLWARNPILQNYSYWTKLKCEWGSNAEARSRTKEFE